MQTQGDYRRESAYMNARAAFQAAVRCYPRERWRLLWGAYIVEKYEPANAP